MIWRDLKAPEVFDQVVQNDDHRRLMETAGYTSAALVPLVARGRELGTIGFLHVRGDERYDATDLEFLAELGSHAAMALDNARLFRERDEIARNLQRGLRPPQPAPVAGLEISVFFEAAGEGIEVGGDLYDVLPTEDGCWILVGDVAGKGTAAAGVSVAMRHAVRGLTREVAEPEEVLNRVNELLLEGTGLNDFATALLLRLRQTEEGWSMALAVSGHPPAVHVGAEGAVRLGGGTVLGAWPEAPPQSHEATLLPSETLVLCTDGWFEAGPVAGHRTAEELAEMAEEMAELPLADLTERLRRDVLQRSDDGLRDDVVLLAVRPTAQPSSNRSRTAVPLSEERI
jgi:serine phosphatase RsbU (regulator of sigma subunit)